jgi:Cu+-exporting ATPase
MEKDSVCGMDVDPSTAQHKSEHQGKTYSFCAPGCRRAFEADPDTYPDPSYEPSM